MAYVTDSLKSEFRGHNYVKSLTRLTQIGFEK